MPDPDALYDEIQAVRPVRFFGVPRVYEKLVDRARAAVEADPALGEALVASLVRVRSEQMGRSVTPDEERAAGAGVAALAGVRRSLGLDRAGYLGVALASTTWVCPRRSLPPTCAILTATLCEGAQGRQAKRSTAAR